MSQVDMIWVSKRLVGPCTVSPRSGEEMNPRASSRCFVPTGAELAQEVPSGPDGPVINGLVRGTFETCPSEGGCRLILSRAA